MGAQKPLASAVSAHYIRCAMLSLWLGSGKDRIWLELSGGGGSWGLTLTPPQFMSTDTYFRVKIGFKFQPFQPLGKILNISAADPQFF